jgi:hypothetical protein
LERGDLAGASHSVLEALARALTTRRRRARPPLHLARAAQPIGPPPRRRPAKHRIRLSVRQLLDAMTSAAAHVGTQRQFYLDWDRIARDVAASLRSAADRNPYDRDLSDLVGELSTRSDEFRQHWARHDVCFHLSGVKHFHHSQVGDLELNYERLEVVFDTDLTIVAYTADPGTRSAEALSLLGSLAATSDAERASAAP